MPAAAGRLLARLARRAVEDAFFQDIAFPVPWPEPVARALSLQRGCFVTITRGGRLRGCIGHLAPRAPLREEVEALARAAAFRDPRFEPLRPEELGACAFEVSVLTRPRPLEGGWEQWLKRLRPGVDGVVLDFGFASATFLPSVWRQLPEKEAFLRALAQKAGLPAEAWRAARCLVYQALVFTEPRAPSHGEVARAG